MDDGMRWRGGGWDLEILVNGFPGKADPHGGLGWSTVLLLRGHGRVVLLDGGGFGMRRVLVGMLAARGLAPGDVTDLLLSHLHHDHCVNWPIFRQARIHAGRREMAWALGVPWGETPVPEHAVAGLSTWPTLVLMDDGAEVLPGITAHLAPGHTPGHLIFVIKGDGQDCVLLQDAVKNRVELTTRRTDMTYDPAVSRATIDMVWEICRARPGCVLIPGHDLPMVVENGIPRAIGAHRAGIKAWFGDDLDTMTRFDLAP
ncbi:MBL fold metallo-hydrolase [Roseomonas sp. PWR1]|uniref:MBL fold metallo-hydrolase n=1 Tax=Roseomonas nitratireducens TaxID=2820810 RepID=A0ABS4AY15_9PROT|nr:MBL fold metallo-hydrolase [Neoroseomonas nitratireducens]MBP0465703.1 MBL fold metallo-hydrolase [Neoroseomonas nitratireducens]